MAIKTKPNIFLPIFDKWKGGKNISTIRMVSFSINKQLNVESV